MYGEMTVQFTLDTTTGAPASDPQWVLGVISHDGGT
jgi:hypothetical protein